MAEGDCYQEAAAADAEKWFLMLVCLWYLQRGTLLQLTKSRFNTLPGVKHDGNCQKRNGHPTKFKFLNFVNNYYYLNI